LFPGKPAKAAFQAQGPWLRLICWKRQNSFHSRFVATMASHQVYVNVMGDSMRELGQIANVAAALAERFEDPGHRVISQPVRILAVSPGEEPDQPSSQEQVD